MALNSDRLIEYNNGGLPCSVCSEVAKMTPEDHATLKGWFEAKVQYPVISRWLKEDAGIELNATRLGHHARTCMGIFRGAR